MIFFNFFIPVIFERKNIILEAKTLVNKNYTTSKNDISVILYICNFSLKFLLSCGKISELEKQILSSPLNKKNSIRCFIGADLFTILKSQPQQPLSVIFYNVMLCATQLHKCQGYIYMNVNRFIVYYT